MGFSIFSFFSFRNHLILSRAFSFSASAARCESIKEKDALRSVQANDRVQIGQDIGGGRLK